MVGLLLPALLGVVLHGEALQIPDGDGLVEALALTALLAVVGAHIAQSVGEGDLLPDDGHGLVVLARGDHAQVVGHVDVGGALQRAGDEGLLPGHVGAEDALPVLERAGGAHLHAGAAEAAVGLGQEKSLRVPT